MASRVPPVLLMVAGVIGALGALGVVSYSEASPIPPVPLDYHPIDVILVDPHDAGDYIDMRPPPPPGLNPEPVVIIHELKSLADYDDGNYWEYA